MILPLKAHYLHLSNDKCAGNSYYLKSKCTGTSHTSVSEAVSLQVVALNKSHVTHATSKRLFSCDKVKNSETHQQIITI